ncbi:MAG TPA: hypothetical protein VMV01_08060, partial [Planctomycetota bacterium]|nr:hypothetical protein [Planctomycetota bacterium]
MRQIQAEAESNAPLREWIERLGLGGSEPLFHKLRIDAGWETAVEAVLRERLHALQSGSISSSLSHRPPTKAALFEAGSAHAESPTQFAPLATKVHVVDASIGGALADWMSGVYVVDGTPEASTRARLAAGQVLVNRDGDQFTRHTISFHAPDRADAGILARQAEIESLEARCAGLGGSLEAAQKAHEQAENVRNERETGLEEARLEIGRHEKA